MERIVCKEKKIFGGVIHTQVIIEAMLSGIYWAWMKLQKINSTFLRL